MSGFLNGRKWYVIILNVMFLDILKNETDAILYVSVF